MLQSTPRIYKLQFSASIRELALTKNAMGPLTAHLERHQYYSLFSAFNQASSDYLDRHHTLFCTTSPL